MKPTCYIKGQHNFICMRCGFQRKSSEKRLDGYIKGLVVCKPCYDREPPLERPPHLPKNEMMSVYNPSPDRTPGTDDFIVIPLKWEIMMQNWEDYTDNWEDLA